jgi:hypothetical protein
MGNSLNLTDENKQEIQTDSTDRLGSVLHSLNAANSISEEVNWQTELWPGTTVEEVIGALVEAEEAATLSPRESKGATIDRESVICSEFDDHYHHSKSGYYTTCGSDFNPHHAVSIERNKAKRLGFTPCQDCGLED